MHHRAAALTPTRHVPDRNARPLRCSSWGAWAKADRDDSSLVGGRGGTLGTAAIASLFALVNITKIVLTAKAKSLVLLPELSSKP